jgi:hypothetical protein
VFFLIFFCGAGTLDGADLAIWRSVVEKFSAGSSHLLKKIKKTRITDGSKIAHRSNTQMITIHQLPSKPQTK